MEIEFCKKLKPTTQSLEVQPENRSELGMTLVELLVSIALLSIILVIALNTFLSSNRLVETDTARISATQSTQGAMDLLVADVRQAGENLDLDLGISGIEFDNSGLIVRRSIPPITPNQTTAEPGLVGQTVKTMPLCDVNTTARSIQIVGPPPATTTTAPSATSVCTYSTRPSDNEDDNVKIWRVYFAAENQRPQVAILSRPATSAQTALVQKVVVLTINPTTTQTYSGGTVIRRASVILRDAIPNGFTSSNGSTITLLDERRYFRNTTSKDFRLALGGQADTDASILAFNVTNFSATATLAATNTEAESTVNSIAMNGPWNRVKAVNLSLTGGSSNIGRDGSRTFTTSIFPRNVESAQ